MTISVLIVTRNRANHLDECLDSIRKQTIKADEVVVVDNNSTDATYGVFLKHLKNQNIKLYKETQTGIAYARQNALDHATGDIIAYIDDDCVADKNWIKSILTAFNKYPKNIIALQGKSLSYYKDWLSMIEQKSYELWFSYEIDNSNKPHVFRFGSYTDTKNFAISRKFAINNKLKFNEKAPHKAEDTEFGIRMKQKMSKSEFFVYLPNMKVKHRHPNTIVEFIKKTLSYGCNQEYLKQFLDYRKMHDLYIPHLSKKSGNKIQRLLDEGLKNYLLRKINRLVFRVGVLKYKLDENKT